MYHEKVSIPAKYRYFADSADFGPKIASDCAQTRLRAQKMTILTEFSRENREENRGGCREKRKGKQTGCERQTCDSPTPDLARLKDIVSMVGLYNIYTDTLPPRARLGPPRPSSASRGPPAAARCGGVTNPTSVHRDAIGRSEVQLGVWIARPGLSPGPLNGRLRCRPHEVLFTPVQPFVQQGRAVCGWQQTQMTTGCSLVAQRQHCA